MADFGSPIAQVDPNKGLETLNSLLGIQRQSLALKGQAAEVQQQQQTAQQRAALAQVDWSKHIGPDGVLDTGSFAQDPAIRKAAGDQYPEILEHANLVRQGQIQSKQQLFNLNASQNAAFQQQIGALTGDSDVQQDNDAGRQKVKNAMSQFGQIYGPAAQQLASVYRPMVDHVPPGKLSKALQILQLQSSDVGKQLELTTPHPAEMDTGAQIVPGTRGGPLGPQPGAFTPSGAPVRKQLSPGIVILKDANNKQYRYNTQTGQIEGQVGAPAPGGTKGQGGFTQPIPDQEKAQEELDQTRKADADYGYNRHINEQILRLSKDTATGPGTEIWHHALGAISGPMGGNNVADYQTIGAYLDRQAALSARQMGLPDTNAGLATAASLSGTTGYQPKALQTKVQLTDALVEGAHQYRNGLDKVVGTGPNQDLSKYQQYRAAWAANFDPNVYLLENAHKKKDTGAVNELLKSLSPEEAASLRQKRKNLQALADGKLPE